MPVFRGIEGARAWLAWIVVLTHIIALTGLGQRLPFLQVIRQGGDWAVQLFIIISGFVITHLLLVKKEPYSLYIGRRFLRLYPAYIVSLIFALLVTPFAFDAFDQLPWHDPGQIVHMSLQHQQISEGELPWHLFWHALLLHGAIPSSELDQAQYMFLTPAWSVSLEWQFYLVAPLVVSALTSRTRLPFLLLCAVAFVAYSHGFFGRFDLPSFLPGAIGFFLVGTGTRLAVDRLPRLKRYPLPLVIGCMILALGTHSLIPLVAWIALVSYALLDEAAFYRPDLTTRVLHMALDSRLAVTAGLRSYSVYIVHWVVLNAMIVLVVSIGLNAHPWTALATISLGTVACTALVSEMLYRLVELPGIALGRSLARRSPEDVTAERRPVSTEK